MPLVWLCRIRCLPTLAGLLCISLAAQAASPDTHYLLYCSGCHRVSGEGKPPNVPSLHDELGRMMQVPAMRQYLVRIPGVAQAPIDDAELTEVINWVLQTWNAATLPPNFQPLTAAEVAAARRQLLADPLRYRIAHWKDYPH